jgi:prepilin-type N-terminal cleavage/methylation domain-containing protein
MKRITYKNKKGFTLVEMMVSLAIFMMITAGLFVTVLAISKSLKSRDILISLTKKASTFDQELGFIVMPSATIEFRDGGGAPYDPPAAAPASARDAVFFYVMDNTLNWKWMKIWYNPTTSEVWMDKDLSNPGTNVERLLKDIERYDYQSAASRGTMPVFQIVQGSSRYLTTRISILPPGAIFYYERDPVRLKISKRIRNT